MLLFAQQCGATASVSELLGHIIVRIAVIGPIMNVNLAVICDECGDLQGDLTIICDEMAAQMQLNLKMGRFFSHQK